MNEITQQFENRIRRNGGKLLYEQRLGNDTTMAIFAVSGKLILVQSFDEGGDVYVPIINKNSVSATLEAIDAYAGDKTLF